MARLLHWLKSEFLKVLPLIIYFLIAFNLTFFTIGLTLPPNAERLHSYESLTIAALVIGKIVLIADTMPFVNAFPEPPLIYNLIWKTFFYNIFVTAFRLFESAFHLVWKFGFNEIVLHRLHSELTSPVFWANTIVIAIFFFFFILFSEIKRAIGTDKFMKLLFGFSKNKASKRVS